MSRPSNLDEKVLWFPRYVLVIQTGGMWQSCQLCKSSSTSGGLHKAGLGCQTLVECGRALVCSSSSSTLLGLSSSIGPNGTCDFAHQPQLHAEMVEQSAGQEDGGSSSIPVLTESYVWTAISSLPYLYLCCLPLCYCQN